MAVLGELNAPQSKTDWFAHMFQHRLDIVEPDTLIKCIHISNYSSASEHPVALCKYLDEEVKKGHFL
jgi:hypothetical protein